MNAGSDAYLQNKAQYNIREKKRVSGRKNVGKSKNGFFSTIILFVLVFGAFAFLVWGYQGIFTTENYLNSIKGEIDELEVANDKLILQIAVSEDVGEIQRIASDKLNMGFPEDDQIVTVNLPKEQETEDKKVESIEVNIFAIIKSIFE